MRALLVILLGIGAIYGVRRLRQANRKTSSILNDEAIEQAKEEILLGQFDRWDREGVNAEDRVTQLQEMLDKGELPDYVEDVNDPDAVRVLINEHVEPADN